MFEIHQFWTIVDDVRRESGKIKPFIDGLIRPVRHDNLGQLPGGNPLDTLRCPGINSPLGNRPFD